MENTNCKIMADSINSVGDRLTSILFKRFPYCLIQEPGTHRMNCSSAINPFSIDMSRNSASTRAISLTQIIEQVQADPFIPTFELNQPGMSGKEMQTSNSYSANPTITHFVGFFSKL